jgi:hypothetical protein
VLGYYNYHDKTNVIVARCVRGGPLNIGPFDPLVISGDRIVNDAATALMWQGCPAGQSGADCSSGSATGYAWQKAKDYCDGLVYAGYDDWRLPDDHELFSIVDYSRYQPAIDITAFPATPSYLFWSSSSHANYTEDAWYVYFDYGEVSSTEQRYGNGARCVRGGP